MPLTIYADFQNAPFEAQRIAVVGLGYIGLPTAVALANAGHEVIGVDIDARVVDAVNTGESHIVEPGLDEQLAEAIGHGRLSASTQMPCVDAYLIAVPTPVAETNREPDLSYVFAAAEAIAPKLRRGALVVLESTSPVGATRQMVDRLSSARPDLCFAAKNDSPSDSHLDDEVDVDVVYSPERVIPGKTLVELARNARVLGGVTPRAAGRAARIYRSLTSGELLLTDDRSAEMVKLVENAFRDTNIAFANELSIICDRMSLNVWEVIALANHHPRVDILQPGPGVGGHCIAVDPWFIVSQAPAEARLIRTAREVNDAKPLFVLEKARLALKRTPNAKAACLGLAFKADVDDFRESPSLQIARTLSAEFPGRIVCADPYGDVLSDPTGLDIVPIHQALDAEIVLGLVGHREFRAAPRPKGVLIDACGVWS